MNAENYKAERKLRGTQASVAVKLGVHQVTIARRETGQLPIPRESELALLSLPKMRKKTKNEPIVACAVHFVHYNFCRIHQTLRVTPAMAAGLTDR